MTKRNVLVTYPNGSSSISRLSQFDDGLGIWVQGHGPMASLIEQHGCTVMPLLVWTPERVRMLETLLMLAEMEHAGCATGEIPREHVAAINEARLIFAELGYAPQARGIER